jgi:hypothetical protein
VISFKIPTACINAKGECIPIDESPTKKMDVMLKIGDKMIGFNITNHQSSSLSSSSPPTGL